jgi:hypothetical protein
VAWLCSKSAFIVFSNLKVPLSTSTTPELGLFALSPRNPKINFICNHGQNWPTFPISPYPLVKRRGMRPLFRGSKILNQLIETRTAPRRASCGRASHSPPPAALAGGSYRLSIQTASKPHNFYTRLLRFSSRIYMRLVPNCLSQSAGPNCVIDEDHLTWSSLDSSCRTLD